MFLDFDILNRPPPGARRYYISTMLTPSDSGVNCSPTSRRQGLGTVANGELGRSFVEHLGGKVQPQLGVLEKLQQGGEVLVIL